MPSSATRQPAARRLLHELLGVRAVLTSVYGGAGQMAENSSSHRWNSEILAGQQISGTD